MYEQRRVRRRHCCITCRLLIYGNEKPGVTIGLFNMENEMQFLTMFFFRILKSHRQRSMNIKTKQITLGEKFNYGGNTSTTMKQFPAFGEILLYSCLPGGNSTMGGQLFNTVMIKCTADNHSPKTVIVNFLPSPDG